jgi:hypothetical protein
MLLAYRYLILLYLASLWITAHSFSYTYDVLRPRFHQQFVKSCSKYPFYHQYLSNLEHPPGRFVVFVFQENKALSGGLGDRMAGLITAAGMAIRFNRTVIIRSQDGLDKLFRPYIPPEDEDKLKDIVQYGNGSHTLDWARYNKTYEDKSRTEFSLHFCVHHSPKTNYHEVCSNLVEDPEQPIILYRGNRCYMCAWYQNQGKARQQLLTALGSDIAEHDLLEVAGCLLRLTLWPTDYLWSKVDEKYKQHYADLYQKKLIVDPEDSYLPLEYQLSLIPKYTVTLHFRCGDTIYGVGYRYSCQHIVAAPPSHHSGHSKRAHHHIEARAETAYMRMGTPDAIARCARENLLNLTKGMTPGYNLPVDVKVAVNILSDAASSYAQMRDVLRWHNLIEPPKTCHVDLDQSHDCLLTTVVPWFVMSQSDFFFIPSKDRNGTEAPGSAFSRFAAIYGLKENSMISGRTCNPIPRSPLSRKHHENWFCEIPIKR